MICSTCAVTYHELCAHANKECKTKKYEDGCPTCHIRALGGWGRNRRVLVWFFLLFLSGRRGVEGDNG